MPHPLMNELQGHLGLDNYNNYFGWTKMGTILNRGDRAAKLAEQIATALLSTNRKALYTIFNDGSIDANGPAEDIIAKIRHNWKSVFPPESITQQHPTGMTGIMAGIPSAPSKSSGQQPQPAPQPAPQAPAPGASSQGSFPFARPSSNQPQPGTKIRNRTTTDPYTGAKNPKKK